MIIMIIWTEFAEDQRAQIPDNNHFHPTSFIRNVSI